MTGSEENSDARVRLLLVEDALDQALLLQAFLGSQGRYDVTHAADGERAVELLDEEDFDIVVTDLNLPGLDGMQVLRHLRSRSPDAPALAITGYRETEFVLKTFRAGAHALLHKPVDRDDFLKSVELVLEADLSSQDRPSTLLLPPDGESG